MKLLNKTIRSYLGYSIIILLVGIPVFYLIIEQLYILDVDEALVIKKEELQHSTKKLQNDHDIRLWLAMDNDVKIIGKGEAAGRDSIYQTIHYDPLAHEMEPYRELSTWLTINGKVYNVIIRASLVESEDMIIGIAEAQAILLIVLFAGLLFINQRISKNIWRPFYDTVDKMEKFQVDKDSAITLMPSGIHEFETLNKAISQLAEKSYRTYINQKEFTENAAHEMQTPLAVFQSSLDMLMQTRELSDKQAKIIGRLYNTVHRLSRLYRSLLLLSKIENNQYVDTENLKLSSVTDQVIGHFSEQIEEHHIKLQRQYDNDIELHVNSALIEILISNLLTNAIQHNISQGYINIYIKNNELKVVNSGAPLQEPAATLFERFKKDSASRGNTGLGLAITEKICALYGFRISYRHEDGRHELQVLFTIQD
jgi:signal transduction histidine kinase